MKTITTQELEHLAYKYGDSIYGFCLHLTATVVYKDGHEDSLQLSGFFGAGDKGVIQFSPWTELQKHLEEYVEEGRSLLELKDEWDYNFSIYTFELDKISSLQICGNVLDVKEATYH